MAAKLPSFTSTKTTTITAMPFTATQHHQSIKEIQSPNQPSQITTTCRNHGSHQLNSSIQPITISRLPPAPIQQLILPTALQSPAH
jgi:hypothetical protein